MNQYLFLVIHYEFNEYQENHNGVFLPVEETAFYFQSIRG